MLFSKISVPFFVAIFASAQAQQQNITYSVISSPPPNMGIAVVVDGTPFPLQANQGILYQGKAPIAQKEYHYAIIESNTVKVPEPFTRSPIQKDTSNEFFNRTLNTHNITSLPQVMTPVPILHRIKSDLHAEGQIPTYHLWGNETAVDYLLKNATEDIDIELNFTYIGLDKIETFEGVKVSLAGRSSRMVDKVSFGIKLKKKSDDTLFGYKNLKLRAMAMDPTYVREKAVHSALKAVGVPASDFSYVRLFINNKPAGLYGVIETFQDPWLASEFKDGDKNYKSGYLYQAILAGMNQQEWQYMSDLSYYDNITTYTLGEYKIKAGPSKDSPQDFSDLQEFTKFIHDASNTTTIDDWQKRMDVDVFLRAMTIENLLGFSDALMTMSNNFNFYKNPEDGRMIYIPYDFDTTLGTGLFEMNLLLTGNYTAFPGLTFRPLSKKFFSYDYFSAPYQNLLVNVTKSLINPTVMNPFFDSVTKMIQPDIEWDMSLPKLTHGAPSPEPGGNMTEIAKILPPGFLTNWTKIPEQYLPPQEFIAKKSAAVLGFYNQSL